MKKRRFILPMLVPLLVVGLLLTSCDDIIDPTTTDPTTTDPTSSDPTPSDSITDTTGDVDRGELLRLEYVSGLKEQYMIHEQIDLDEVNVQAVFENDSLLVTGKDLTFNPLVPLTNTIGVYHLEISYLEKSITRTYWVVEFDEIDNLDLPSSIAAYQAYISEKGVDKRSEFMDRTQGYFVGSDNPWRFFPEIEAYDDDGEEVSVSAYHSSSKIFEKRAGEYVQLTGDDLDNVVTIDEFASTYHFTSAAIDKTYRLTVRPYGEKYATKAKYEVSFEIKVTQGYNVTKQDDLLHFDNYNSYWDPYRASKNITPINISGLILHNDIKLKEENIADGFKYLEGDADVKLTDKDYDRVIGSLRDNNDLYRRTIGAGEHFVFNGNYFNIDYTALPYVVREGERIDEEPGKVISHFSIFKVHGEDDTAGNFTMKNLSATGNANRTEVGIKSGGGMFLKVNKSITNFYNTIVKQAFTILISENEAEKIIIEKSRGYDTFSSLLYSWGTIDFTIKDSEFIGAGGPVIIADHYDHADDGTGGYPSNVKVINSKLESWVFGQENWFTLVSAIAVVPQIIALGVGLRVYGTNTIIRGGMTEDGPAEKFNLIGVMKSGGAQAPTSDKIQGTFQIDETVGLDFDGPFMSAVAPYMPVEMPRFQSSGGEVALHDGKKLVDASNQPIIPYEYTNQNHFSGDYMNVYFNFGGNGHLGIVFGLADYITDY